MALGAGTMSALILVGLTACGDNASPAERYPLAAEQNVDAQALADAHDALAESTDARCLLVERNGSLVMEDYFGGAGRGTYFDVRSVTKSVVSLLVGQAIRDRRIRSLDQTIGDFLDPVLPGLGAEKRSLTVRQLLTMTTGLPWRELGSTEQDFGPWIASGDQLRWILDKPFETPPGTRWHYNNATAHVLSPILAESSHVTTRSLAERDLFGPLGGDVGNWPADSRGYNYGGHGICLTARTMVRLGRLVLDGGNWQGQQLVPRDWIEESTSTKVPTEGGIPWGTGYGYLWWTHTDSRTGLRFFYANGYGGQFIVDVPARDTTIVATMAWSGLPGATANANWSLVMGTIVERILPALR